MKNVEMKVDGDILTLRIDLQKTIGKSNSGKSVMIACAGSNICLPGNDEVVVALSVYKKYKPFHSRTRKKA